MTIRASVTFALVVSALTRAEPVAAQVRPVARHPAGYAITLPSGWRTETVDASQVRLVPGGAADGATLLFVVGPAGGVTSVTDPASIRQSEEQIRAQYPQFRRVGAVRTFTTGIGSAIRLDFEQAANGTTTRLSIYAGIRNDETVSVMAAGPATAIQSRLAALDAIVTSLRSDVPPAARAAGGVHDGSAIAREWSTRLAGRTLVVMSGYSGSGGSGGMTSRADLRLQRDGRFSYTSSSSVSISVDGLGGSSSGRNAAQGTWRMTSRGGAAILVLTSADGAMQQLAVARRGTQTFLNGTRAFVTTP